MRRANGIVTGALLALLAVSWTESAAGQASQLSLQPPPDMDAIVADPRRALVLEVSIDNGSASLLDTYVSTTPPASHVGDPGQLRLRWFDANGIRVGSRNAWDPRLEFEWDEDGIEHSRLLPTAIGAFAIPFSANIVNVAISEPGSGLVLLDVDVRNTVVVYCQANPTDPNCEGAPGGMDDDGDGIDNDVDNCPADANPDQLDADSDNVGDVCDSDDDNDGVDDSADNCPADANPDQADEDADNIGDVCDVDDDNDGVVDGADNCPVNANPDQADTDNDGIGDACDADTVVDSDHDGITDESDYCPDTVIPESVPASGSLGNNRWALYSPDGAFTQASPQAGSVYSFTLEDTRGCSCEQIVAASGLGAGQVKNGCSTSAMLGWINNP